jgi:membrane protein YqaA with SNARE-associated domain
MTFIDSLFVYLSSAGPLGVFFLSALTNATVFLPLPALEIVLFALGSTNFFGLGFFSPLLLGACAGLGASIGELSAYFLGRGGRHVLKKFNPQQAHKIKEYGEKLKEKGFFALAVFAFLPLPFDLAGVAAGLVHFPMHKFMLGCAVGKTPRYAIIAYAGYFGVPSLLQLFGLSVVV